MRYRFLTILISAALTATSVQADGHIDAETVEKIQAVLAEMQCQMDPADIEVEEDGYDLDDVICVGGNQFDITLDKEFNEIGRRAE